MKKIVLTGILLALAFAAANPLRAYVNGKTLDPAGKIVTTKWKNTAFPITWKLNPTQGANITGTRTQADVFAASFAAWQGVSTASITFTQGAVTDTATRAPQLDGMNVISTNPLDGAAVPVGVLALTQPFVFLSGPGVDFAGQIQEADIFFSSTQPFSTTVTAVADRVDLQSVATHEIGHFLGLDHSPLINATMFWAVGPGFIYPRVLSSDDAAAVSLLYPSSLFAAKGKISGTIRTTANAPVFGAVVVAVNSTGTPVASSVTDPAGAYTIEGLDAGSYTVYTEPLDGPITITNIPSLPEIYPSAQVNSNFATRFR